VNKRENIDNYCLGKTKNLHPNHVKSTTYPIAEAFQEKNRYIFNNINNIYKNAPLFLMGVSKEHLQLGRSGFHGMFEQS
jgi:hypothetical protein